MNATEKELINMKNDDFLEEQKIAFLRPGKPYQTYQYWSWIGMLRYRVKRYRHFCNNN